MSKVVSFRLNEDQVERLHRAAHRSGRKVSETAALMIEEGLRKREFSLRPHRGQAQNARLSSYWHGLCYTMCFDAEIASIGVGCLP